MASQSWAAQKAAGGEEESSPQYTRGHWRPSEDEELKQLVARHGPQNWNLIAQHLHGRSGKSCRLRWFNQLDPRINRAAFSAEEERRLVAAHRLYGNKWACIARLFPGRTDNAVKNHWHVVKARHSRHHLHQQKKNADPAAKPNMQYSSSSLASRWPMQSSPPSSHVPASSSTQLGYGDYLGKVQEHFWFPLKLTGKLQIEEKLHEARIAIEKFDQTCKSWNLNDSKLPNTTNNFCRNYQKIKPHYCNIRADIEAINNENLMKDVPFIDFLGVGNV